MKTVRCATFETNSSSTHAICMCSEEDYQKFKNMELFWKWSDLKTAEELYDEFSRPYSEPQSEWEDWKKDVWEKRFLGKLPSFEQFKKAITTEGEWHFISDDKRGEYDSDEEWIIANIQSLLVEDEVANASNYNYNGDWYYATFKSSFNGVVAFGYYGNQ